MTFNHEYESFIMKSLKVNFLKQFIMFPENPDTENENFLSQNESFIMKFFKILFLEKFTVRMFKNSNCKYFPHPL